MRRLEVPEEDLLIGAVAAEQVGRLDVTVDDPLVVERREPGV